MVERTPRLISSYSLFIRVLCRRSAFGQFHLLTGRRLWVDSGPVPSSSRRRPAATTFPRDRTKRRGVETIFEHFAGAVQAGLSIDLDQPSAAVFGSTSFVPYLCQAMSAMLVITRAVV